MFSACLAISHNDTLQAILFIHSLHHFHRLISVNQYQIEHTLLTQHSLYTHNIDRSIHQSINHHHRSIHPSIKRVLTFRVRDSKNSLITSTPSTPPAHANAIPPSPLRHRTACSNSSLGVTTYGGFHTTTSTPPSSLLSNPLANLVCTLCMYGVNWFCSAVRSEAWLALPFKSVAMHTMT